MSKEQEMNNSASLYRHSNDQTFYGAIYSQAAAKEGVTLPVMRKNFVKSQNMFYFSEADKKLKKNRQRGHVDIPVNVNDTH